MFVKGIKMSQLFPMTFVIWCCLGIIGGIVEVATFSKIGLGVALFLVPFVFLAAAVDIARGHGCKD